MSADKRDIHQSGILLFVAQNYTCCNASFRITRVFITCLHGLVHVTSSPGSSPPPARLPALTSVQVKIVTFPDMLALQSREDNS